MKIFIDFDDVLFCTRDFKVDFKNVFKNVGVSSSDFEETYKIVRNNEKGVDGYNYDDHIKILDKRDVVDGGALKKAVNEFLINSEKYVFSDVVEFLEKSKSMGDELFMISFGSECFQKSKIENSGLGKYFSDIKIGDIDKAVEIEKIVGENVNDEMWFIDDRIQQIEMVKKVFPEMKTVLLKRKEGRYFDEKNEFCDFEAGDFGEVENIICEDM